MEAATGLRSPRFLCRAPWFGSRSCVSATQRTNASFDFGGYCPISLSKQGARQSGAHRSTAVRASARSSSESATPIAPLQLESPIGQFLSQILRNHPHLLRAAVDQQLEQLQSAREAEQNKEEPAPSGTDVLYRRIAEVKANERKRALEEILYASVVQNFVEVDVPLVDGISRLVHPSEWVDNWPSQDDKVEKVHSREAYEMVNIYLGLMLWQRLRVSEHVVPISKLRLGQVYAASIMFGYFLKRVDQRFQLEKSMKTPPWGSDEEESAIKQVMPDESKTNIGSGISHPVVSSWSSPSFNEGRFGDGNEFDRLRSYIMSLDSDTSKRYATIRSEEALAIIMKHTVALFGRDEIVITPGGPIVITQKSIDSSKDKLIKITYGGLKRLLLEAVTFGSFLWDNESYVDSRYHFVTD